LSRRHYLTCLWWWGEVKKSAVFVYTTNTGSNFVNTPPLHPLLVPIIITFILLLLLWIVGSGIEGNLCFDFRTGGSGNVAGSSLNNGEGGPRRICHVLLISFLYPFHSTGTYNKHTVLDDLNERYKWWLGEKRLAKDHMIPSFHLFLLSIIPHNLHLEYYQNIRSISSLDLW